MPDKYNIPQKLREHGLAAVHPFPSCANEDSNIVGRFNSAYAFANFPKLELQPPHVYASIILDCDTTEGLDDAPGKPWWGGNPTPTPSWMVVNTRPGTPTRRQGGIHAVYAIETPVARHNAAHALPLAYLSHVADRLTHHLGADPAYQGFITRNPIHPGPECYTHWGRLFPYTLGELDKLLPKGKPPSRRLTGIGRNCDLFRSMVSEVFRPAWADTLGGQGWTGAWLEHVRGQNIAMFAPYVLPDSECRSVAKSCFRYWTQNYDPGPVQRDSDHEEREALAQRLRLRLRPASPGRARAAGLGIEASHDCRRGGAESGAGISGTKWKILVP